MIIPFFPSLQGATIKYDCQKNLPMFHEEVQVPLEETCQKQDKQGKMSMLTHEMNSNVLLNYSINIVLYQIDYIYRGYHNIKL